MQKLHLKILYKHLNSTFDVAIIFNDMNVIFNSVDFSLKKNFFLHKWKVFWLWNPQIAQWNRITSGVITPAMDSVKFKINTG